MDVTQGLLLVFALLSAGGLILREVRHARRLLVGWAAVAVVVATVGIAGAIWYRATVGYGSLAAFLVLVAAPLGARQRGFRASLGGSHKRAWLWSTGAAVLHPADGWVARARLDRVNLLSQAGDETAVREALSKLASLDTAIGRDARVLLHRLDGDWAAIADLVRGEQGIGERFLALRALAEAGHMDQFLRGFAELEAESPSGVGFYGFIALAYAGQVQRFEEAASSIGSTVAPGVMATWRATALQRAGRGGEVDRLLAEMARAGDVFERNSARRRRTSPLEPIDLAALGPEAKEALDRIGAPPPELPGLGI